MRKALGVFVGLAGLVLAVYVGVVVLFVGGISDLVDAVQADPVSGGEVAWGIVKVIFASTVAAFIAFAGMALGGLIANDD